MVIIFIITTKEGFTTGKAFQESWFLSENLKNGKKLAGKKEKKNGTYIMQKGPGGLRELERGQKQFSKERSLLIFSATKD